MRILSWRTKTLIISAMLSFLYASQSIQVEMEDHALEMASSSAFIPNNSTPLARSNPTNADRDTNMTLSQRIRHHCDPKTVIKISICVVILISLLSGCFIFFGKTAILQKSILESSNLLNDTETHSFSTVIQPAFQTTGSITAPTLSSISSEVAPGAISSEVPTTLEMPSISSIQKVKKTLTEKLKEKNFSIDTLHSMDQALRYRVNINAQEYVKKRIGAEIHDFPDIHLKKALIEVVKDEIVAKEVSMSLSIKLSQVPIPSPEKASTIVELTDQRISEIRMQLEESLNEFQLIPAKLKAISDAVIKKASNIEYGQTLHIPEKFFSSTKSRNISFMDVLNQIEVY
ncbi:hypothetical protein NEFER01_1411 [Nematocida sp. LUAm1]|nr:hypothetical protein NEFER02_2113 [Nematocida sp. LUAm2]KAI5178244.1 hypothetical protein NEFER01_1411 [Nematocida sp. LUAm1]